MHSGDNKKTQAVTQILSYFNLGNLLDILPIKQGISNSNYFVNTTQGKFVLKFLIGQSEESIKNDISIQKQLSKVGIEAPVYVQNEVGRYIYKNDKLKAVVAKKIDGIVPRITNDKLAKEFGEKLSMFHTSVLQLPNQNNKGLMNPQISGIRSDIFSQHLPKGVIHGDFHLGNTLVNSNQDKIVAILDFEEAGTNLFLIDLAVTVMGVCSLEDPSSINLNLVRKVIQGYQSVRSLSSEEKESFSEAIKYSAETWIKWFRNNNYEKYAKRHRYLLDSITRFNLQRIFH